MTDRAWSLHLLTADVEGVAAALAELAAAEGLEPTTDAGTTPKPGCARFLLCGPRGRWVSVYMEQAWPLAGAVIVTTPQDIALLDARKGIEMFRKVDVPVLGVIENMAVHICSECGHREHIFGEHGGDRIAKDYGVPLLASLPLTLSIREQTDAGTPTVATEPDSAITQMYLEAAAAVRDALTVQGDSVVKQFPEIKISDD